MLGSHIFCEKYDMKGNIVFDVWFAVVVFVWIKNIELEMRQKIEHCLRVHKGLQIPMLLLILRIPECLWISKC